MSSTKSFRTSSTGLSFEPYSFSIGGSIPVTWSYFAEYQPKSVRGKMLSIIATFWMIGNVIVAGN